ncbi:hypothetical protein BJX61DRAFT_542824 [Aspergillus egyptiacus]|nr:hypothetical protein BJX61DRAFT_542824 [Aspergillus egyptiacus]
MAAVALATLTTANPLQIQVDIPNPNPNLKPGAGAGAGAGAGIGALRNILTPGSSSPSSPATELSVGPTPASDDDKLGIQYGQCYRVKDSNGDKLGLYGVYYQFGGQDGNRPFRVCREAGGGGCKHEDRSDQTVRRHEHFYLKDLHGSSISGGATWVANGGSLLYPLPRNYPDTYKAKLWGYRVCEDPDDDDDDDDESVGVKKKKGPYCETCISQKNAWNNWNGLSTQANTRYVVTSPNADQCVYFKFTKVRCPMHMLEEGEEYEADKDAEDAETRLGHWDV